MKNKSENKVFKDPFTKINARHSEIQLIGSYVGLIMLQKYICDWMPCYKNIAEECLNVKIRETSILSLPLRGKGMPWPVIIRTICTLSQKVIKFQLLAMLFIIWD